ncbi:hypothetical protein LXL04_016871 [Taraxacum kok-saghyz]
MVDEGQGTVAVGHYQKIKKEIPSYGRKMKNTYTCHNVMEIDDDLYILPVLLLRFDGQLEGNILFRFASLQKIGASGRKEYAGRKWSEVVGGVDKFFKEKKWDFRLAMVRDVKPTDSRHPLGPVIYRPFNKRMLCGR